MKSLKIISIILFNVLLIGIIQDFQTHILICTDLLYTIKVQSMFYVFIGKILTLLSIWAIINTVFFLIIIKFIRTLKLFIKI